MGHSRAGTSNNALLNSSWEKKKKKVWGIMRPSPVPGPDASSGRCVEGWFYTQERSTIKRRLSGGFPEDKTTNEPVTQQNSYSLFCPDLQTGEKIIWRVSSDYEEMIKTSVCCSPRCSQTSAKPLQSPYTATLTRVAQEPASPELPGPP